MKYIYIKIVLFFLPFMTISAQEIKSQDYAGKIIGDWSLLQFDETSEDYIESGMIYRFNSNNTLQTLLNNKIISSENYELIITKNYTLNGEIFSNVNDFVILKTTDSDLITISVYAIHLELNNSNVLTLDFEGNNKKNMTFIKK
jgi:hypothetical protein